MRVHTLPPDFLPAGFVGIHLPPNFVELGNQSPGYPVPSAYRQWVGQSPIYLMEQLLCLKHHPNAGVQTRALRD